MALHALQALLHPELLGFVRDVRELGADGAAVGRLQGVDDVPQRGFLGAQGRRAGLEDRVEVGLGEAVVAQIEHRRAGTRHEAQGIEVGDLVPSLAVGLDEFEDPDLLLLVLRGHGRRGRDRARAALAAAEQLEVRTDRCVRYVVGDHALDAGQLLEVLSPGLRNARGVFQEALVELLDVGDVAAGEMRRPAHHLHEVLLHGCPSPPVRRRGPCRRPHWPKLVRGTRPARPGEESRPALPGSGGPRPPT